MTVRRLNLASINEYIDRGSTVLVPNNRLQDIVRHTYAEQQAEPVFQTPDVVGIDVWITRIWNDSAARGITPYCELQPLSTSEELFIWIDVIEESLPQLPLLNPEETANVVSRAYQIMKQWRLDQDHLAELEAFKVIPDIAAFLGWKEKFEQRCKHKQLSSLVDCLLQINSDLADAGSLPLAESFLILNFYQPPPLYAELFEHLGQLSVVHQHQVSHPKQSVTGERFEFATSREEFSYVANWASKLSRSDEHIHIGIIGELDESQRTELHRVLALTLNEHHAIEFDATHTLLNTSHSKKNLTQEAVIHDALSILNFLREELISEDVCRLLRSPFVLAETQDYASRTELEKVMRRRLSDRCLSHEISALAKREDADYHCPRLATALLNVREHTRHINKWELPRNWGKLFTAVLAEFEWPGNALTGPQKKLILRWEEAMSRFASLNTVTGKLDINKAIACLRNLCVRSRQTEAFDSRCQISQYTIEEATGIEFDHVWLLNFNDQVWPPAVNANPFLPYPLQKDQKVPGSHSDTQHANAKATFQLLCNAVSKSLSCSHHISDGDQEFRASSFAAEFIPAQTSAENQSARQAAEDRIEICNFPDSGPLPLQVSKNSLGGHNVLSDQSSCPFRAFALHRLDIEPLEAFQSGLSKMSRGSAMHRAMEYIYQQIQGSHQLLNLSASEKEQLCHDGAREAISYLTEQFSRLMTPRFEEIEFSRIQGILFKFLDSSFAEQGRGDFQVMGREERHQWQYEGMTFNLVIDRIDQLADGSMAVIDYKTGKSAPGNASWLAERPEDMQIPFYYTVMSSQQPAPVNAVAIAHLNAAKIAYSGLAADANFHDRIKPSTEDRFVKSEWTELTNGFTDKVKSLATEFKNGHAVVNPVNGSLTCRYCALENLCRIEELNEFTAASAETDIE